MKFVVITSIFSPTEAVRAFAARRGWQLIVVGDRKTPSGWSSDGVEYLGPDQQEGAFGIAPLLPWNHYCRKMIGYLQAIAKGANAIADTDDDNIPYDDWSFPDEQGSFRCVSAPPFYNVYRNFTSEHVWPRGLPLTCVTSSVRSTEQVQDVRVAVWQGLADGEPDVDAIYRLTVGKQIVFSQHSPLVLVPGTVCPFNSQNTLFFEDAFPLLYLPTTVTFRFTDILRSLVAQPILWADDLRIGFTKATVRQDRNDHDYLSDFESEIPMYLHSEKVAALARASVVRGETMNANLMRVYGALAEAGIVHEDELGVLTAWLADLKLLSHPS